MSNLSWSKKFVSAAAMAATALVVSEAVLADDVKPATQTAPATAPAAAAPAVPAAKPDFVTANSKDGFSIQSGDGAFQLKLRGYLQGDARVFVEDPPNGDGTEFLLRRVRPIFEGTVYKYYKFRIMPDFGGGSTSLQDGYVETAWKFPVNLRAGKFKAPVGLERLQSATALALPERGLPTNLVPNRDVGVQLQGLLGDGVLEYQLGVFDGTPDGSSVDRDSDDQKEFAGRVFATPFKNGGDAVSQLSFGVAATVGKKRGETGATQTAGYRAAGQATFFNYAATSLADGTHWRVTPQATWYVGPFGLLGEYVLSSQVISNGTVDETVDNQAWQALGTWVLTGEAASYKGVSPKSEFSVGGSGLGAFELAARVGGLEVDDDAFPVLANPATAAEEALGWGVGLNWYWNKNVKISGAFEQTYFDGGDGTGDRDDENVFFTRAQIAF